MGTRELRWEVSFVLEFPSISGDLFSANQYPLGYRGTVQTRFGDQFGIGKTCRAQHVQEILSRCSSALSLSPVVNHGLDVIWRSHRENLVCHQDPSSWS
jgi:hypothetical protein